MHNVNRIEFAYDGFGRVTGRTYSNTSGANRRVTTYTYQDVGTDKTATLVQSVQTAAGTYTYTYDAVGNILSVSDGTYTNSYVYDSLNQLVRENNQQIGKTYTYAYVNGNITEKKEYAYTTGELPAQPQNTYTWAYTDSTWSDLLTNFNGTAISYDEIGNPVSLDDVQLSWNGRQLQQITGAEGEILSYCYNTDGQRISKTMTETNGTVTTTEYFYNGSILAGQKCGDNTLVFMYDNNGQYYGFTYNGATYYYLTNIQGDVDMVLNSSRAVVAKYAYDAWGNVVSVTDADGNDITDMSHIGHINPIRYRGYFYDAETGFYYLNSRYYDPGTGRFVNADDESLSLVSPESANYDKNCFAYCDNNPINRADSSGEIWHIVAGAVVGGVVSAAASAITQYVTEGKIDLKQTFIAAGSGALSGGLAASGLGLGAMVLGNAAISAGESILSQGVEKGFNNIKMGEVALDAGIGAVSGLIGGKGTGNKNLTNLGKQSVRRTTNALKYGGITRAKSEARKAARYYIKSTGSYYVKNYGVRQLAREFVGNIGTGFASNYFARKWGLS